MRRASAPNSVRGESGQGAKRLALRLLLFATLSLVVFLSGVGSARAQSGSSTPEISGERVARRDEAKRRFDRGLALAKSGQQWDAALAEFLASRELYPTRAATRNAAVAFRQLGQPVEAIEYYQKLLGEFGEAMPAEELAVVRSEMSSLRLLVGELEVRTEPSGTAVVIDGQQRGVTPLSEAVRLKVGTHTVRLSKDGFEALEVTASVAGDQRKLVSYSLKPLRASGTLVVREASGAELDVVLDAAVVGKTPWSGNIAVGPHSVALRGPDTLGTAPSAADVNPDQTTLLTLRAVRLEGTLVVEPSPSGAAVYVDGVGVGNGIWEGRLPSGTHRIEVVAGGHLPFRREVALTSHQREVVGAVLERDVTSPLWKDAFRPRPYVEISTGLLLASSLHGGADNACNCSDRSRPFGGLAQARVGYELLEGLGIELNGGYLGLSSELTRQIKAFDQLGSRGFKSKDYQDATTLRGPFAALSTSYRLLSRTPLTARATLGLASLSAITSNAGTFTDLRDSAASEPYASPVSIDEVRQKLLTPFVSTELRLGYRFSKRLSADFGLALMLLLPPKTLRAGNNNFSDDETRRIPLEERGGVDPGVLSLPKESITGPFLALSPTIGVRVEL